MALRRKSGTTHGRVTAALLVHLCPRAAPIGFVGVSSPSRLSLSWRIELLATTSGLSLRRSLGLSGLLRPNTIRIGEKPAADSRLSLAYTRTPSVVGRQPRYLYIRARTFVRLSLAVPLHSRCVNHLNPTLIAPIHNFLAHLGTLRFPCFFLST